MTNLDTRMSNAVERWAEKHRGVWTFGAAYALWWFVIEAIVLWFVMPSRPWIEFLAAAAGVHIVTLALQLVIRRSRPRHHASQPYRLWIHTYSFPSAHASSSFGCAVLGSLAAFAYVPAAAPALAIVNLLVAAFIAFSRVAVGVHFVFDVLVGSLLGMVCAWLFASVILG